MMYVLARIQGTGHATQGNFKSIILMLHTTSYKKKIECSHHKISKYFSAECSDKSGTSSGSCADGFGVCCTCKILARYKC